ncbi:MAG: alanine racemase [Deltaproteobacteria bacterium]
MINYDLLDSIANNHGASFYLFYPERFVHNLNEFSEGLSRYYQNSKLAYALKANYMPKLCKILQKNNYLAEVVSGMEYDIARLYLPGDSLIFNGPCKSVEDIRRGIEEGAIVNLDSFYELDLLEKMAGDYSVVPIGLRVNFDIGVGSSRFGFNLEEGAFSRAVSRLAVLKNVQLVSLHSHFTTRERSLALFVRRVDGMTKAYDSLPEKESVRYLNLGGGYFGPMSDKAKGRFPAPPPTLDEYAEVIGGGVADRFPNGELQLILEPGVSMVADAMDYVVQVLDDRTARGTRYLTVDGSINCLFPTGSHYVPDFTVVGQGQRSVKKCHLSGYTCMEHDILMRDAEISAAPGDFIVFHNRGAYSNVYKPPFIREAPAIIGIDGSIYARRQTFHDIVAPYV